MYVYAEISVDNTVLRTLDFVIFPNGLRYGHLSMIKLMRCPFIHQPHLSVIFAYPKLQSGPRKSEIIFTFKRACAAITHFRHFVPTPCLLNMFSPRSFATLCLTR